MKKIVGVLVLLGAPQSLIATTLVEGNASSLSNPAKIALTFNQRVTAKAFDHTTGTLFLGLAKDDDSPIKAAPKEYTISKIPRVYGRSLPIKAIPIAPTNLQNFQVDFLSLATFPGNTTPNLVVVEGTSSGPATQTVVNITSFDGKTEQESPTLLGVNPAPGANGPAITGILNIASNRDTIFAATRQPNSDQTNPDIIGIASVSIAQKTLQLEQQGAVQNDTGVKAVSLFPSDAVTIAGTPSITPNRISMVWDEYLQRLYIGLQVATANPEMGADGDGARSVVVAQTNQDKNVILQKFVPDAAFMDGQDNNIVGVKQVASQPNFITAAQLKVMHTTTGASYLIVLGGNGTISTQSAMRNGTTGNTLWALPLVDRQNPTDPMQGTLANKNMFNATTHRFETSAAANGDLTQTTDLFAQVGNGPLPLQAMTPVWGFGGGSLQTISKAVIIDQNTLDIEVVGDTVYVAIASDQTSQDDTGVYYSQALFDQDGKIIRWTPWAKRAFPYDAFANTAKPTGTIRYVAVDPVVGKVIAADGDLGQSVRVTSWQQKPYLSPLPTAVNPALRSGCYSVLDLDASTPGFTDNTASRYALFGGIKKVVFARTAQAMSTAARSPQQPITDFANPQNLLVSSLPNNAGCITTLAYSKNTNENSNYFFAGSTTGLFVFDQEGSGFSVDELNTLNQEPFIAYSWKQVPEIFGAVVDLQTNGNVLYVLTVEGGNEYKIWALPYADEVATMVAKRRLLAQSGVGAFETVAAFYGMQPIAINEDGTEEQLVLATNRGIYQTTKNGGAQIAINQTDAQWQLIPSQSTTFFTDVFVVDAPVPTQAWPISLQDPTRCKFYNAGGISQLTGGTVQEEAPPLFAWNPLNFTAQSMKEAFSTIPPISSFWSDGGRRFFILNAKNCACFNQNQLMTLPYQVAEWGVTTPLALSDTALNTVPTLNWIQQIGATGVMMAGTNAGVIALE